MEEVRGKYISPAIDQLAFTCPHCNALAKQFWFSVHADPLKSDEKPVVATAETVKTLTFSNGNLEEAERDRKLKWAEQMASGRPFLEVHREFRNRDVQNVSISYCFSCNEMCLWVYDQLVWPRRAGGPELKPVAPPDVRRAAGPVAHIDDVLAMTFLALAAWAVAVRRPALAGFAVGLAVASKPWAVIALPSASPSLRVCCRAHSGRRSARSSSHGCLSSSPTEVRPGRAPTTRQTTPPRPSAHSASTASTRPGRSDLHRS